MSEAPLQTAAPEEDGWAALRRHTAARIALGRSGASLPTREVLAFELAHAQARDAVHGRLDLAALRRALEDDRWPVIEARSRAPDLPAYLARPDWGRRLDAASLARLAGRGGTPADLAVVIGDGLSAAAAAQHAVPVLRAVRAALPSLRFAPVVVAECARVALADEIGQQLGARCALILIGERPGLSSPDSLGAYITHAPRVGRSDAERNCVSNIRPQGLVYAEAAAQIAGLIGAILGQGRSGIGLQYAPPPALS